MQKVPCSIIMTHTDLKTKSTVNRATVPPDRVYQHAKVSARGSDQSSWQLHQENRGCVPCEKRCLMYFKPNQGVFVPRHN